MLGCNPASMCVCVCVCVCTHACTCAHSFAQSSPTFVTPWTVALQAPLSMGFPRQEYWSELPFPSPGDPSNPGIKPTFLASPALVGKSFITAALEKLTYPARICLANSQLCLSTSCPLLCPGPHSFLFRGWIFPSGHLSGTLILQLHSLGTRASMFFLAQAESSDHH